MSVGLLREYVALVMEKIRTKKGQKGLMGEKFDLKRFKSLPDERAMLAYASKFLDKLGQGSSRAAFLLSGKYALKIALNDKGLAQNDAELEVFTNPKSKPIVAKVYGADENNRWLISDLVRPLKTPDEFASLTGTDWDDFVETINDHLGKEGHSNMAADEFTSTVIVNAKNNALKVGDIEELSHWGKTPDGRAVLLDYGFTESVWQQHYRSNKVPQAKSAGPEDKTAAPGKVTPTNKNKVDPYGKTGHDIGRDKTVAVPYGNDKTAQPKKNPAGNYAQNNKTVAPQKKADTKRTAYRPDEDPEKTRR